MAVAPNTPLRYLFVARFTDGTYFEQTIEDKSRVDKEKSAFFDLLKLMEAGRVVETFHLVPADTEDEGALAYAVDLRDGHFEVNGVPIWAGSVEVPAGTPLQLVYFRRNWRSFEFNTVTGATSPQTAHELRFFLGWQATIDGKVVKNVIGVD